VGGVASAIHLGDSQQHPATPAPQSFSGQDTFRAVVFSQGTLARDLSNRPALRDAYRSDYAANNSPSRLAEVDAVLQKISMVDPTYFVGFATAMNSGDPFAVSDAMSAVPSELKKVGVAIEKVAEHALGWKWHMNWQLNFNVHTNINVVLNENVAINNTILWADEPGATGLSNRFQREVLVGEITAALKS
jgi:SdpC family antimicrobial peptide